MKTYVCQVSKPGSEWVYATKGDCFEDAAANVITALREDEDVPTFDMWDCRWDWYTWNNWEIRIRELDVPDTGAICLGGYGW